MSQLQLLRAFIRDRLIAAADEIFGAVERTVAGYQEEVSYSQGLNTHTSQWLNVVVTPEIKLSPPEPQQCSALERSLSLDQENPDPTPIKEEQQEQQELCISQGKPFQGLEEEDEDAKGMKMKSEEDDVQTPSNTNIFDDSVRTLEEQIQTHVDERTLRCRVYVDRVGKKRDVKDHTSIPTEEHPYKCTECSKSFNNPSVLQLHMRIHRKTVFHSCIICNKRWKSKSLLEIHMRAHTGERPFRCNICPFSSSQRGHLKTHMRTHTGERPYTCTDCGKRFTQSSNLRTHMKIHTDEKPV